MDIEALREHVSAWYKIRLEEMLRDCCVALRPFVPDAVTDSELRRRFHGILSGIVAFTLAEGPEHGVLPELGAVTAGLTGGSRDALVEIRLAIEHVLLRGMPDEWKAAIRRPLALTLAHFEWGYIERRIRQERDVPNDGVELATTPDIDDFYRQVIIQHPRAMFVLDTEEGAPVLFNPAFEELFGFTAEEELALTSEQMRTEDTPEDDFDLLSDMFEGRIPYLQRETAKRHKDGRSIRFRLLGWPVRDAGGEIRALAHMLTPLDADPHVETRATAALKRIRYLTQLSSDPILVISEAGTIRFASPSTESVLGFDPHVLQGEHISRLLAPADHHLVDQLVATVLASPRATATVEFQFVRNDGITRWFEVVGTNMLDVAEVNGIALQARDVSERKRMEQLLASQALLDPLTGLLNRRGIVDRIDRALARHANDVFPHVGFIDLDGFKIVNDTFGHQVGDETLVATARRIQGCLDESGYAARLGGDEFVVLLEGVSSEVAQSVFTRIQDCISAPIEIEGELWNIHASIGIARGTGDAVTTASLLHDADVALYQMKGGRPGTLSQTGVDN